MTDPFQIMPALDAATEAALRASIERFGVLVPVAVDQDDRILDGHHRARIATELDVRYPTITHWAEGDEHAREIARTLNEDRRQLPVEQRREIVADLRDKGHSLRAIGGAVGVDAATVHRDLAGVADATPGGHLPKPAPLRAPPPRVTGLDGKSYPAVMPKPPVDPVEAWLKTEGEKLDAQISELMQIRKSVNACKRIDWDLLAKQLVAMAPTERNLLASSAEILERTGRQIAEMLKPKLEMVK